jgi:predicted sugar kinase
LLSGGPVAHVPLDVAELIAQIDTAGVHVDVPAAQLRVAADPSLVRAMLEGLLALLRQLGHPVTLHSSRVPGGVMIEISSPSPGHRSEAGLGPGATLCLAAARRVMEIHGGEFETVINAAAGVRARALFK